MNAHDVYTAAAAWEQAAPGRRVVAIGEQPDFASHVRAFERAMGELLALNREDPGVNLGLALPFDPVEQRAPHSFRRAMKKYTRSVVFENTDLALLLVRADRPVEVVPPDEVNAFLESLDVLILDRGRGE